MSAPTQVAGSAPASPRRSFVSASLALLYGIAAYALGLASLLYAIGFAANAVVPKTIDSGPAPAAVPSMAIDLALLGLFAAQHSIMARRSFKRAWTRIVPPAVERSTYVLAASLVLALLMWQWRPIPAPVVWEIANPTAAAFLWGVFGLGWVVLLVSTFLINHFELFGLRQVFARATGRSVPEPEFRTPALYRYVRHPIYLGLLMGFWATPSMTLGHLLFAVAVTAYILVGIAFEERDLVHQFGDRYRAYREQVGMLLPRRRTR